jgi:HSP20 family protein
MTTLSSKDEKLKRSTRRVMELSAININEEEREYVLFATASGLRREDFSISVDKKVLTVIAAGSEAPIEPKKKGGKNPADQVRTFTLPDNADPLLTCATYNNGSLEIHIPKGRNTEDKP